MIIYLSMLVVVYIGYMMQKIRQSTHPYVNKRASKTMVFWIFGYIVFWVGVRDAFVDTAAYIARFNLATLKELNYLDYTFGSGWGFTVIEVLFKTFISDNYHVWLMFLAIVMGVCIAIIFHKYSCDFYYTMFLFLATTTFTWMMNGIRQFLAVVIIFASTPLLEKKKWLPYCIIVLLCSTIHASCIIMIPVYFIVQSKPWRIQTILVIMGALLILVFASNFTDVLDVLLSETKYANVSEKFAVDDGVNPLRVLVYSVTTFLAFLGRKILAKENRIVDIFVNMSIITSGLYFVGMATSGILMGRLPIYTQMYEFILLPYVIERCFTPKSRKIMYIVSIICFLGYFYLMTRGTYYSSEFTGRIY